MEAYYPDGALMGAKLGVALAPRGGLSAHKVMPASVGYPRLNHGGAGFRWDLAPVAICRVCVGRHLCWSALTMVVLQHISSAPALFFSRCLFPGGLVSYYDGVSLLKLGQRCWMVRL